MPPSTSIAIAGSLAVPRKSSRLIALAPWLTSATIVLWALWAAAFNSAQFGDNIEQFNWAHSLEWGYYKHPPMPTWLLGAAISLFGPSRWWAIVMAALCALGTAAFTYDIARQLLGVRMAAAASLLWSLQLCFSSRVQLFNHNTALVMFVAATAWSALRTGRGRMPWWIATGAFAGAALLSKYQALVPLAGLLWAMGRSGRLRDSAQRKGLALAMLVAGIVVAPHLAWVAGHDFTTLRYASQSIDPEGPGHRLAVLAAFVVNQLRMVLPALATALVAGLLYRFGSTTLTEPAAADEELPAAQVRPWLAGLLWVPLGLLVLLDLAGGVTLRNHWGVQTMQFVSLWMAWRWRRVLLADLRRLAIIAAIIQCMSLGLYAVQQEDPDAILSSRRMDTVYPAQRMADASLAAWRSVTLCPLRFVAGESFQAGLVALYAGGTATVFEGHAESPWVDLDEMRRAGALYVTEGESAGPAGAALVTHFSLAPTEKSASRARSITLAVVAPRQPCR